MLPGMLPGIFKWKMENRRIIATSGLPYANGSIHIGHLVEYLQTDFWVRFQKMRGHHCLNICADDTHGTPIMIRARKEGITPEELIARSQEEHLRDFADFHIEFDKYSSTHSTENQELVNKIFSAMEVKGHLKVKTIKQKFCDYDNMFLPDRFVRGECPRCRSEDQYGDSCDQCGATYPSTDLINPRCSLCGNPPIEKDSEHLFFKLNYFNEFLNNWVSGHTSREVANKLKEWLDEGLKDWDISRDAPYFGFEIPGYSQKYFYVWVDAPVGYMSTTKLWCEENGKSFEDFWNHKDTEIYHFIGKDIVYFHTLFWPAMLENAGYKTPSRVCVHGFLTVNGEKMSKSKGTFVGARTYLNHLDPTYLRYYYACKLHGIEDIDLNLEDFIQRVNSDLIGKITNLGSRSMQMLNKKLGGKTLDISEGGRDLVGKIQAKADGMAGFYENLHFSKALTNIREMAEMANRYFDQKAPWKLIRENEVEAQRVLTDTLNIFRLLAIYLKPILPQYTRKVESLFGEAPYQWSSLGEVFENKTICTYEHLVSRIDAKSVEQMVEEAKTQP